MRLESPTPSPGCRWTAHWPCDFPTLDTPPANRATATSLPATSSASGSSSPSLEGPVAEELPLQGPSSARP